MEKLMTFWGGIAAFGGFFAAAAFSKELWDFPFVLGIIICLMGFIVLAYCGMNATMGNDNDN
jgi:multidrug transporter EmrE-like cation transporter